MIAVTGANGFVGGALMDRLAGEGRAARAVPRTFTSADFAGAEAVVHLAGALHGDAATLEEANVRFAERAAAAAADAGVARFVHVSSGGVYGSRRGGEPFREEDRPNPGTPYEASKLRGEAATQKVLERAGRAWTALRPSGVFGSRRPATRNFFEDVRRRPIRLHGPSCTIMNPVFVDDLVAAIQRVLTTDAANGQVLNIGGDVAVRYDALISAVARAQGRRPPMQFVLQPRALNRSLDIGKARAMLDYSPTPLETALSLTAAGMAAA
jgi:UDP-glucose 4-epimerase